MVSVKEIVPSSQRSTGSVANPLPAQLAPLLEQPLEQVKKVLDNVLPKVKKRTALEEAQWEEDADGEAAAFDREMLLQGMEFDLRYLSLSLTSIQRSKPNELIALGCCSTGRKVWVRGLSVQLRCITLKVFISRVSTSAL